ncbi:unnamed protein product, partial [Ectocarpus sp. 13 AM-2016]
VYLANSKNTFSAFRSTGRSVPPPSFRPQRRIRCRLYKSRRATQNMDVCVSTPWHNNLRQPEIITARNDNFEHTATRGTRENNPICRGRAGSVLRTCTRTAGIVSKRQILARTG